MKKQSFSDISPKLSTIRHWVKNGHFIKKYPNPSRTVVSLISASFAVENDFRNRSDAFLLNFYIFSFIGQIGQFLVLGILRSIDEFSVEKDCKLALNHCMSSKTDKLDIRNCP